LMLIVAWPQVMIFVIFAGYALSGPVTRVTSALMKATGKQAAKPETPVLDVKE
jgi:CDP-diacylglycerol--serine O-phosphatidyltransferase